VSFCSSRWFLGGWRLASSRSFSSNFSNSQNAVGTNPLVDAAQGIAWRSAACWSRSCSATGISVWVSRLSSRSSMAKAWEWDTTRSSKWPRRLLLSRLGGAVESSRRFSSSGLLPGSFPCLGIRTGPCDGGGARDGGYPCWMREHSYLSKRHGDRTLWGESESLRCSNLRCQFPDGRPQERVSESNSGDHQVFFNQP
jgi:hypothetical protein